MKPHGGSEEYFYRFQKCSSSVPKSLLPCLVIRVQKNDIGLNNKHYQVNEEVQVLLDL